LYMIYPISWILCSLLHFITILVVSKKIFPKNPKEQITDEQSEAVA